MKMISDISLGMIQPKEEVIAIVCDHVFVPDGIIPLDKPVLSSEHHCVYCDGTGCHTPYVHANPTESRSRAWLCANLFCRVWTERQNLKATHTPTPQSRCVPWPLFCELNGIGNRYEDVTFEKIKQSKAMISFLLKYASNPTDVITMMGDPGTGKTYASLGVCELYTRKHSDILFFTHHLLMEKWLDTFKQDVPSNLKSSLKNCSLLVVDDFGSVEPSPGFLAFFFDVLNHRLQWKNKGTILTTNLEKVKFSTFCGDALTDRLRLGDQLIFSGQSRRIKKPIT